MKRYSTGIIKTWSVDRVSISEDKNGAWVRYCDVEELIKRVESLENYTSAFDMILSDLKSAVKYGGRLATAAQRVVTSYDGVHRLGLALSDWNKCLADHGGRGKVIPNIETTPGTRPPNMIDEYDEQH